MSARHSPTQSGSSSVTLEIPLRKLKQLFSTGQLCPSEVRCADCNSKLIIQRLCLETCTHHFCGRNPE